MITDAQKAMLEAPLDPKHVKKPSGSFGPKGDYLEGWHVINELNRIFGFDGWSYTIELSRDAVTEGKDSKGQPQWQAAYTCVCTLRVGEVTRQDVGFGSGFAKGLGDAIEGATKEAATDALKRAARTFGNAFGLALYDKARVNVCAPAAVMISDEQRDELQAMIEGYGFNILKVCQHYKIASLKEIPANQFEPVKTYLNAQFDKKKATAA
jgi:DNA recombination protein Rad52